MMHITEEDLNAADALVSARPAWTGLRTAADAVGLEAHTILHCGPPAQPHHALVTPTLNSAAVACVFEGWATDLDEGLALVKSGAVRFEPAQPRGVATPMAAVVSPSMRLLEMTDLARRRTARLRAHQRRRHRRRPGAALRTLHARGAGIPALSQRTVADLLEAAAGEPLAWLPIIDDALVDGDDTHLRHVAAHALLVAAPARTAGPAPRGREADEFIGKWPFFHLNFWMAGIRVAMQAASGGHRQRAHHRLRRQRRDTSVCR